MIQIIIFIFIQIILESLPISSSGHYALAQIFLNLKEIPYFDYFLHLPTIIILMVIFYKDWFPPIRFLVLGFFNKGSGSPIKSGMTNAECGPRMTNAECGPGMPRPSHSTPHIKDSYKKLLAIFYKTFWCVFISTLATVIIWALFKFYLEDQTKHLMFLSFYKSEYTLLIGFCITAMLLFGLKSLNKKDCNTHSAAGPVILNLFQDPVTIKFLILGLVQGLAQLPGISRFATVFFFAVLLFRKQYPNSLKRPFQITFLIQLPIIIAGFLLGTYKLASKDYFSTIFATPKISATLILAIIVATIISGYIFYKVKQIALSGKLYKFTYYMIIPISILILKIAQCLRIGLP